MTDEECKIKPPCDILTVSHVRHFRTAVSVVYASLFSVQLQLMKVKIYQQFGQLRTFEKVEKYWP